jgi:hypothetical protein
MKLINFCSLSKRFWMELIVRLWMRYFKNEWSDCKNVSMKMVNMLSDVEWCWVMLSDVEWCWVMLSDVEWCWMMLSDVQTEMLNSFPKR